MNVALQFHLQRLGQQLASSTLLSGYFVKIDLVPGTAKGAYAGWVEIDSFQWNSRAGSNEILLTKAQDKASPYLMNLVAFGRNLDVVMLDLVSNGNRTFRITMKNVIISSFSTGKDSVGKKFDSFTLSYQTIEFLPG